MKCFAPWHSITVRFNGDIVPCCVYKERYGNVLTTPLNTVLDSLTASHTKDSRKTNYIQQSNVCYWA